VSINQLKVQRRSLRQRIQIDALSNRGRARFFDAEIPNVRRSSPSKIGDIKSRFGLTDLLDSVQLAEVGILPSFDSLAQRSTKDAW
jgi:hypothetical protein